MKGSTDKRAPKEFQTPYWLERLEERLLLSADPIGVGAAATELQPELSQTSDIDPLLSSLVTRDLPSGEEDPQGTPQPLLESDSLEPDTSLLALSAYSEIRELVFVDVSVADYQILLDSIEKDRQGELLTIMLEGDGVELISDTLAQFDNIQALHLISHGSPGQLTLGDAALNSSSLPGYQQQLVNWQAGLSEEADILIYGCNLAANAQGQVLLTELSELTGADVAASEDLTGSTELGGDWSLEYHYGNIETRELFSQDSASQWQQLLVSPPQNGFILATAADVASPSGVTSLTSWGSGEVLNLTDPNLALATDPSTGTLNSFLDLSSHATDGDLTLDGLHMVTWDLTVGQGADTYDLQAGDILFSTDATEDFSGLTVTSADMVLFRPTNSGDYSSGTFTLLLENPVADDLKDFALVEQTTTVAGATLNPGDFLYNSKALAGEDIWRGTIAGALSGSTSVTGQQLFIDGTMANIDSGIRGVELVQQDHSVGGITLKKGELVVSLNAYDDFVGNNNLADAQANDLLLLQLQGTGASTNLDAAMLFDGSEIGLDSAAESPEALALIYGNNPATGLPDISGVTLEDKTLTAGTSGLSDPDGISGSFSYQWQRFEASVWTDISGATASTYLLGDNDVGKQLRVGVSFTDDRGFAEGPIYSLQTGTIDNLNDLPTGAPSLVGTVQEDQTLSVDNSTIVDVDGISGAFTYQWQRYDGVNWSDIGGETDNAYTLDDADVDKEVRVKVEYTDDWGTAEGPLYSASSGSVANFNDAPTGVPTLFGSATEDQILTGDTSGISDPDGMSGAVFSYQWQRYDGANWNDISGATGISYTLDDADVGRQVRLGVSYVDDYDSAEGPVYSAASATIANINDPASGAPTITGTATEDQTLTAVTSGVSDPDGTATSVFSYQWQRFDGVSWTDVSGATSQNYTLGDADVGLKLRVAVTFNDDTGVGEGPLYSVATAAVANLNDDPTGLPTISGTATEDQTLSAVTSSIADIDGLGSFNYQWQHLIGASWTDISGATGENYILDDADVDKEIRVKVWYTDGQGTRETLYSAATAMVANVNDSPQGSVSFTGTLAEYKELFADTSTLTDADGTSAGFFYQWQRYDGASWQSILGAKNSSYTLTSQDIGSQIRLELTYNDDQGTFEGPLYSPASEMVANTNDLPSGQPAISGAPREDQTLSVDAAGITDIDGISGAVFSYQWQRLSAGVWSDISGATTSSYLLGDLDAGKEIRVGVSYTDDRDSREGPIYSDSSGAIANVNDLPVGSPQITGESIEDGALQADLSSLSDQDGISIVAYQWQRFEPGLARAGWEDIAGANAATYNPTDQDVGKTLRVAVSYTDDQGTDEGTFYSGATAEIANINDLPQGSVSIVGQVGIGQTMTLSHNLTDADGLGDFSYQWEINGQPIAGATGDSYQLSAADIGQQLTVTLSYQDQRGTAEAVTSSPLSLVVTPIPTPIALVQQEAEVAEEDESTEESLDESEALLADEAQDDIPVMADSGEFDNLIANAISPFSLSQLTHQVADSLVQDELQSRGQESDSEVGVTVKRDLFTTTTFSRLLSSKLAPLALYDSSDFIHGLNDLNERAQQSMKVETTLIGGSIALSTGLSIGYVIWLARSGVLLSTVLSSLPAWRFIDPLPILSHSADLSEEKTPEEQERLQDIVADHQKPDETPDQDTAAEDKTRDG
ncbi:DUF4347 domain-containing protein [Dongshaea marina]|uniref:DUF4347 domain-containing protein n=1 Tax=Dongshaea marina TaxID=2047966 RepID=UPI00131EF90F|nr:DUF4347 domain-containing protein [Dongshaea marina]